MRIYFIILFFIFSCIGIAQNDSIRTYELKQINVTATKFEQLLRTFTPSYTVLSENEIKQDIKPSLLSSISVKVPGFFVTETGVFGYGIGTFAPGKISIRGINGIQQTLVIIDGRPEFAGIFGHPVPDVYQSSEIAAVDVIRGPASVLYGTNAMGGVISITTKKNQQDGTNFFADVNYGSFQTRKIKSSISYKKGSLSNSFSLNSDYSKNHRPSSTSKLISAAYSAEYTFNPIWSMNINAQINSSKVFNPGPVINPYLNDSVWTNVTRASASLNLKNKFDRYEGSFLLYFNNGVHDVYDGFHSNDYTLGFALNESVELFQNNIASFGVEVKNYRGKAKINIPLLDKSISEKAVYLILSQRFLKDFFVNGGLRYNHHSVYGPLLIPQLNMNYIASEHFNVYCTVAEGFRNPTLNELFLFGANIQLKPEKLWNYEVGVKCNLLKNNLQLNGSIFLMEGKDFINMVGIYPNIQNQNLKSLTNRGLELETKFNVIENLSLSGSYSYLKSSEKLLGVPQHQLFAEADYHYKIIELNANLKSVYNLYTSLNANEKKQNYILFNTAIWINLLKHVTLYLKLDNIFNTRYEIIDGYPMPGRTALIGINFDANF